MICYGGYPWDVFPFLKKNGAEVNEGEWDWEERKEGNRSWVYMRKEYNKQNSNLTVETGPFYACALENWPHCKAGGPGHGQIHFILPNVDSPKRCLQL